MCGLGLEVDGATGTIAGRKRAGGADRGIVATLRYRGGAAGTLLYSWDVHCATAKRTSRRRRRCAATQGAREPFGYRTLERQYAAAERILGVSEARDDPCAPPRTSSYPSLPHSLPSRPGSPVWTGRWG